MTNSRVDFTDCNLHREVAVKTANDTLALLKAANTRAESAESQLREARKARCYWRSLHQKVSVQNIAVL